MRLKNLAGQTARPDAPASTSSRQHDQVVRPGQVARPPGSAPTAAAQYASRQASISAPTTRLARPEPAPSHHPTDDREPTDEPRPASRPAARRPRRPGRPESAGHTRPSSGGAVGARPRRVRTAAAAVPGASSAAPPHQSPPVGAVRTRTSTHRCAVPPSASPAASRRRRPGVELGSALDGSQPGLVFCRSARRRLGVRCDMRARPGSSARRAASTVAGAVRRARAAGPGVGHEGAGRLRRRPRWRPRAGQAGRSLAGGRGPARRRTARRELARAAVLRR